MTEEQRESITPLAAGQWRVWDTEALRKDDGLCRVAWRVSDVVFSCNPEYLKKIVNETRMATLREVLDSVLPEKDRERVRYVSTNLVGCDAMIFYIDGSPVLGITREEDLDIDASLALIRSVLKRTPPAAARSVAGLAGEPNTTADELRQRLLDCQDEVRDVRHQRLLEVSQLAEAIAEHDALVEVCRGLGFNEQHHANLEAWIRMIHQYAVRASQSDLHAQLAELVADHARWLEDFQARLDAAK